VDHRLALAAQAPARKRPQILRRQPTAIELESATPTITVYPLHAAMTLKWQKASPNQSSPRARRSDQHRIARHSQAPVSNRHETRTSVDRSSQSGGKVNFSADSS